MSLFVLDASVAVKWYLPRRGETLVDEAFDLLRRHIEQTIEFVTPDLFWAEFGNVLWKSVWRRRWTANSAAEALRQMRAWRIPSVPARDLVEDAWQIAAATGQTIYDSLYIALAVQARAEMVTADERLANAMAARFPVRWIGVL